jgi:transposase-like protein
MEDKNKYSDIDNYLKKKREMIDLKKQILSLDQKGISTEYYKQDLMEMEENLFDVEVKIVRYFQDILKPWLRNN